MYAMKFIALGGACVLLASATPAWSAQRTVCFQLKLADDRTNCATTSETGNRRGCNRGGLVDAVGHQYQLWDKDSDGNDELIGTWYIGGAGRRCTSFAWEGTPYHKGEANPDVYIRYINQVNRTGYSNYVRVKAVRTNGSDHPATTWRNGQAGDADRYVARNCQTGTNCQILPGASLVPTFDVASERALRIMALDSAQHALQAFGEIMDRHVNLHYPGRDSCPTSCAVSRTETHITQSRGNNGFNVAHEIGHIIQMQEFNQDSLRNDCSRNGNGHSLTSIEHESCATTEGWANFIGVVSWYEPNNASTVPFGWGRNFETAAPFQASCTDNAHSTYQVAKAFWDLDDFNNENGSGIASSWDDRMSYSTTWIAQGWRQFPNGTSNRQDFESGADGVNMRDYYWNNTSRFNSNLFETLIRHNCLTAQDNN